MPRIAHNGDQGAPKRNENQDDKSFNLGSQDQRREQGTSVQYDNGGGEEEENGGAGNRVVLIGLGGGGEAVGVGLGFDGGTEVDGAEDEEGYPEAEAGGGLRGDGGGFGLDWWHGLGLA